MCSDRRLHRETWARAVFVYQYSFGLLLIHELEMDELQQPITSRKCIRCKAEMMATFAFCAQCGLPRDPSPFHSSSSQVFASTKKPNTSKDKNKLTRKVNKNIDNLNNDESETTKLNLPAEVIAAIQAKLATPVINNSVIKKRLDLQYKTQLLEMKNAEGIEHVALNKKAESVALNSLDIMSQSTIEPTYSLHYESKSHATLPIDLKETSLRSSKHRKKPVKKSKIPSKSYLAEVESVSTHYKRYLDRLKQLEGLRAALMEPPPLPSEQLKQRDQHYNERSISDVYSRFMSSMTDIPLDTSDIEASTSNTTVVVPGATEEEYEYGELVTTPTDYNHHEQDNFHAENQIVSNNSRDETNLNNPTTCQDNASEAVPAGLTFMWGPIFNPDTSQVSDFPLTDHSPSCQTDEGVVRLDSSTMLPSSPSESALNPSNISPSQLAPSDLENSSTNITKHHIGSGVEEEKMHVSAPVTMYWGNIMNPEQNEPEGYSPQGRSPSQRLSPSTSMYGDFHADNSCSDAEDSQNDLYSNNGDAEEKELPMWIEALAAETANIREKLTVEDAEVMHRLGEKLQNLDDRRLRVMSQRALLVQYSTDAVIEEYREKLKRMKGSMGLHGILSRPGTGLKDSEEGQSVVAPLLAIGDLDEERSLMEEEEQGPRQEGLQHTQQGTKNGSRELKTEEFIQQLKSVEQNDKGEDLAVKQETATADQRHYTQIEDEVNRQELILTLVSAHQQQHTAELTVADGNNDAEPRDRDSLVKDLAVNGLVERHITERLQLQAVQEHTEAQRRQQAQSDDDLAMKQWLVAVSAFDTERARKQTLRTLQLEAWEDALNDGDDDDEDDDTRSHASSIGSAKNEEQLASATLDVPENHSLTRIKSLYRQSCSKMLALLSELNVDFTVDQTENMDFRTEARTKVHFARKVLRTSSAIDHKVALEYRHFLDYCALRRTAIALKLSEAMKQAASLEKSYRDRYNEAMNAFRNSPDAVLASTGTGSKHIQSSKHMRAIQKSAELDIAQQGVVVQSLQAEEAKLILDIRYAILLF